MVEGHPWIDNVGLPVLYSTLYGEKRTEATIPFGCGRFGHINTNQYRRLLLLHHPHTRVLQNVLGCQLLTTHVGWMN
jgi:hypothetical protein